MDIVFQLFLSFMVHLFVCLHNFLHSVHPYGYIIFGIGSHIPIFNFEFFCWSEFFSNFIGGTDYFVVCFIFGGGDLK